MLIERFGRFDDIWETHEYNGSDASLGLISVGIILPLADIYENVAFPD